MATVRATKPGLFAQLTKEMRNIHAVVYRLLTRPEDQSTRGVGWRANSCMGMFFSIPDRVSAQCAGRVRNGQDVDPRGLAVWNGNRDGLAAFDIIQGIVANGSDLPAIQTVTDTNPHIAPVG